MIDDPLIVSIFNSISTQEQRDDLEINYLDPFKELQAYQDAIDNVISLEQRLVELDTETNRFGLFLRTLVSGLNRKLELKRDELIQYDKDNGIYFMTGVGTYVNSPPPVGPNNFIVTNVNAFHVSIGERPDLEEYGSGYIRPYEIGFAYVGIDDSRTNSDTYPEFPTLRGPSLETIQGLYESRDVPGDALNESDPSYELLNIGVEIYYMTTVAYSSIGPGGTQVKPYKNVVYSAVLDPSFQSELSDYRAEIKRFESIINGHSRPSGSYYESCFILSDIIRILEDIQRLLERNQSMRLIMGI